VLGGKVRVLLMYDVWYSVEAGKIVVTVSGGSVKVSAGRVEVRKKVLAGKNEVSVMYWVLAGNVDISVYFDAG